MEFIGKEIGTDNGESNTAGAEVLLVINRCIGELNKMHSDILIPSYMTLSIV